MLSIGQPKAADIDDELAVVAYTTVYKIHKKSIKIHIRIILKNR